MVMKYGTNNNNAKEIAMKNPSYAETWNAWVGCSVAEFLALSKSDEQFTAPTLIESVRRYAGLCAENAHRTDPGFADAISANIYGYLMESGEVLPIR
jgi:hypothetical protein